MKYTEAMNYIANTSRFGMNFGLERVQKMLEFLGNPQKKLKCIHIAGTNGKGSTTAMIASVLKEEGYTIGMYTSPYLEEFEERIQVNGKNIPKEVLAELVNEVKIAGEKTIESGFDNPTQFEIITTLMYLYFAKENVDFAVIEVGLGGRLDATNVIENPLFSVITSISFDHMNILGTTLKEIAGEKCGIIKNAPVITYPQEKEALEVIEKVCLEKEVELIKADFNNVKNVIIDKVNNLQEITVSLDNKKIIVQNHLLGTHQVKNTLVALTVLNEFSKRVKHIDIKTIQKGIFNTRWIGRMEVLKKKPVVLIDGAHNLDGIKNLKESVEKYFDYKKMILILGILSDKEVEKMVYDISENASYTILTEPHNERAESLEVMGKYLSNVDKKYEKVLSYKQAFERALELADEDDLILICGSLYMVGDMRKEIRVLL